MFKCFSLYMGIVAILFNGAEPFEQTDNTPSTECPMRNLVKISQGVSEKTFKDYMYTALGQGQITPRGQHFNVTKKFYYIFFYHTLY